MATVTRTRLVPATPDEIWDVLSDAYALPRWWPRVTRVEGVLETGFTEVLHSRKGRAVRLDHNYTEVEEPSSLAWELDLSQSSLARLLSSWTTRFELAPDAEATKVTIVEHQQFRGSFRTGTWMQRRASKQRLDEALENLEGLFS